MPALFRIPDISKTNHATNNNSNPMKVSSFQQKKQTNLGFIQLVEELYQASRAHPFSSSTDDRRGGGMIR
jgi:hypothetical protein